MAYSLSWLAVHGISFEAALSRLGRALPEIIAPSAPEVSGREIPKGWSLFVARGYKHQILAGPQLAQLSADCEVIGCAIEEEVMYCSSELWNSGSQKWRIVHDAQQSFDHLSVAGEMPYDFELTRVQLAAQQAEEGGESADVDFYFDIPLLLAQNRVGFKHDELNDFDADGTFQALVDALAAVPRQAMRRRWWGFWR